MYIVYEVFPDGKKYKMHVGKDKFTCEVWMEHHRECTPALMNGSSRLEIMEVEM